MLDRKAEEYASNVAIPFMSPDLSKIILDIIAKAYRNGAERHGNVWHNLRKNPDDLPKKYGKYWVCREQSYSPDTVTEEMQYGRAGWCADCQNDVIAWCETPKFDEQGDMNG